MINSWTLKNFKSVKELNKLDLAPLTIFAGANSSGKSTILQSILLTAQTLQNSVRSKSVILNGHISRFGTFSDILSNGADVRSILIGFDIEPNDAIEGEVYSTNYLMRHGRKIKNILCEFSFTDDVEGQISELLQLQPKLEGTNIHVKYIQFEGDTKINDYEIVRSKKSIPERVKENKINETGLLKTDLQTLEYEVLKPHVGKIISTGINGKYLKYVGAYLNHFLPNILTVVYDKVEEERGQFMEMLISSKIYSFQYSKEEKNLFNSLLNENIAKAIIKYSEEAYEERSPIVSFDSRIKEAIENLKRDFKYESFVNLKKISSYGKLFIQKLEDNTYAIKNMLVSVPKEDFRLRSSSTQLEFTNYIETFFRRFLKYLGPLRDEPKPVYPLSGTFDPKDIGFKGENSASVLEINKNEIINYIPPHFFSEGLHEKKIVSDTLINAILDWLAYMGVANRVDTSDKGKLGHELKISTAGGSDMHDLTHVGVGVSQVLPILLLSLLADSGSTLIFEQPELHLHPKVQTRLADFFVSMTMLNKQCIVETHSEYLINRLRYQIAISEENEVAKDIIMYFVEKDNNTSIYKKVLINKYGTIEDWPKGFFDENEENASKMLKAAMDKKRKEKAKNLK